VRAAAAGSRLGPRRRKDEMPQYARVATFEFDDEALEALLSSIRSTGIPEGLPAKRISVLADRAGKVVVSVRFDSEEDLRKGAATLDAMSPPEVGTRRRVSVDEYEVVLEQDA
jgi:hypothetical protein